MIVQFFPCGHISNDNIDLSEEERSSIARQSSRKDKLDAPILSSDSCPDCQELSKKREEFYNMWC
jgi:hypothetical protein